MPVTEISGMKPNVVFILGMAGSGKGTQSSKIVKSYKFAHLSAGDLLREELAVPTSAHREVIKKHIDAGSIVPVEITCALIKKRMDQICNTGTWNFLIDGFPRNWNNVDGWELAMAPLVNLLFVLHLDVSEDTCIARCLNRCDGSGRTDDNLDCLKKRMLTFKMDTVPIINYFVNLGSVRKVDASKSPNEVFAEIKNLLATVSIFPKTEGISP